MSIIDPCFLIKMENVVDLESLLPIRDKCIVHYPNVYCLGPFEHSPVPKLSGSSIGGGDGVALAFWNDFLPSISTLFHVLVIGEGQLCGAVNSFFFF